MVPTIEISKKDKNMKYCPKGSKMRDFYIIKTHDGNNSQKGSSGWEIWKDKGNWYHLGGGTSKKPDVRIYKLELRPNKRSGSIEWRWSWQKDMQELARKKWEINHRELLQLSVNRGRSPITRHMK
jgi:hypothetical protein